ncbi:MAG TPA: hypothetical protein VFA59_21140 [Vicinamibacterales bacterium]|nr:hypothetical protein [Vicinamibacterales bacterium]
MHLVQLLLPVTDNDGHPFAESLFVDVRRELTSRFGGVTAYMRAPATGLWKAPTGHVDRDEVVIVEVMVDDLDREWWRRYRAELARTFQQQELVVRALSAERL